MRTKPQTFRITPTGDAFAATRLTPAGWEPIATGTALACEGAILRVAHPWPHISWQQLPNGSIQYTIR